MTEINAIQLLAHPKYVQEQHDIDSKEEMELKAGAEFDSGIETPQRSLKTRLSKFIHNSTEYRLNKEEEVSLEEVQKANDPTSVEAVTQKAQEIAKEIIETYAPNTPHSALERVFEAIAEYTKAMGGIHGNFLDLVKTDISNFEKKTKELEHEMRWQGKAAVGLASLSFALAITGTFIPKPTNALPPLGAPVSRLNANGLGDQFNVAMGWITSKLQDKRFLSTTCKSGSSFFDKMTGPANTFQQAKITDIESKRNLLERFNLQDGQSKKSMFENQVQMAQQAASRILDSKAKGG